MKNIKRVHLVYPVGNKISTPDTIGRHLHHALEKHYQVTTYNYDEIKIIQPGNSDILIGHWHPNPLTIFRMSAQKKGWKRVLALAPFCPDPTGWQNAFGNKIINTCDRFLAITGNSWMTRLKTLLFHVLFFSIWFFKLESYPSRERLHPAQPQTRKYLEKKYEALGL